MTGTADMAICGGKSQVHFVLCLVWNMCMITCDADTNITQLASLGDVTFYLYNAVHGVTWSGAQDQCVTDNMRLAILDDPARIKLIADSLDYNVMGSWLGAKPNLTLFEWRQLNNKIIPTGQGSFDEHGENTGNCLWMIRQYSYQIHKCGSVTSGYICEFKLPSVHCAKESSHNRTSSCLALFDGGEGVSWFSARRECQNKGGDLAGDNFPNDRTEWGKLIPNLTVSVHIGGYRNPWWWIDETDTGHGEVLYYKWKPAEENYNSEMCLTVEKSGWVPVNCNNLLKYYICEGKKQILIPETTETVTAGSSTDNSGATSDGLSTNMQIIIGSLVGGVVVLVVIIVALVLCLRRAKKENKDLPDFQFVGVSSTTSSSMNTIQTSTIGTQASPQYEYAGDVIHMGTDPHSVVNQAYEETDEGMGSSVTSTRRTQPRVNHYASSSIDSVIERGSKVMDDDGGSKKKPKGTALDGLKKRLSLLMKREYQPNRGALPSAPNTLQKSPDVVPMTSLGDYEDISQIQAQRVQNAGNPVVPQPPPVISRNPLPISDKVTYAEVDHGKRLQDDLVIVDNQHYEYL